MFDMHYDLLTVLYVIKDRKYIETIVTDLNNNLKGLVANMYFMSKDEMKEELGIKKINVYKMFKKATGIFNDLNIKCETYFSIEGCDYIKIRDLKRLKKFGLKAILPVWNNKNKYGSGVRGSGGLTKNGRKFIKKAISLDLCIDLSHANEKTFVDIIDVIKKSKNKVTVFASHSNMRRIYNHPRNLNDNELKILKEVDGYVGIVMYPLFISNDNIGQEYLKHIKYAVNVMGIDRVFLSTDNMEFYSKLNKEYVKPLFKYKMLKEEIYELLNSEFSSEECKKLMYKNAESLFGHSKKC